MYPKIVKKITNPKKTHPLFGGKSQGPLIPLLVVRVCVCMRMCTCVYMCVSGGVRVY